MCKMGVLLVCKRFVGVSLVLVCVYMTDAAKGRVKR